MALGTALRNIAAALVVASQSFSDPKVVVMVIVVAKCHLARSFSQKCCGLTNQFGVGLLLLGCAAGAPFLPKLADLAKANLGFAVGAMVLLMVVTVVYLWPRTNTGSIVLLDSTNFTTLFGGTESLQNLWRNSP
jgi:hypothetical protein